MEWSGGGLSLPPPSPYQLPVPSPPPSILLLPTPSIPYSLPFPSLYQRKEKAMPIFLLFSPGDAGRGRLGGIRTQHAFSLSLYGGRMNDSSGISGQWTGTNRLKLSQLQGEGGSLYWGGMREAASKQ